MRPIAAATLLSMPDLVIPPRTHLFAINNLAVEDDLGWSTSTSDSHYITSHGSKWLSVTASTTPSKQWRNGVGGRMVACLKAVLLILTQALWGDSELGVWCLWGEFASCIAICPAFIKPFANFFFGIS